MKYNELTLKDRERLTEAGILNGCGPANWRGAAPQWFFKACCMEHDYNYALGGTEADRRWADWGFYVAMIKDIMRLPWYKRPFARIVAWVFYRAVRWQGAKQFNYRELSRNYYLLTVDQLIKEQS